MTAVATSTPTNQALAEWTKIIPMQTTENYTSSITFIKQLTVVAVSTITYLKNVFPEDSYMIESFGGLKLRILKKKSKNDLAQFLTTALTQAFEAFEKKYLHQLALCFYEEECKMENLIEYHIFEYTYNSEGVTMNIHSKNRDNVQHSQKCTFENIKERTIHMIRACIVILQSCQYELPSTFDVSIRLYYNEDAPEGYQAPGFLSSNESEDHLEATFSDTVKLGWVETPFHKVVARCYMRDSMVSSHEAIPSQNPPVMSQVEQDFVTAEVRPGEMRCPCNKYDDEGEPTLTCWFCQTQQHAICYGILNTANVRHCCVQCSEQDNTRTCTDVTMLKLSKKKRECLCIFRRALNLCSQVAAIAQQDIVTKFGISNENAAKLMKLLHSHGIIYQDANSDASSPREVIADQLKKTIANYFQNEEENIIDRLVAETLASQESQPDPIREVLKPLENVTLQNASKLGRVVDIENVSQPPIKDSTLKQYRDALLSNELMTEDTPLSTPINDFNNDLENIEKRSHKRKANEDGKIHLRTGVRVKRAKALPK